MRVVALLLLAGALWGCNPPNHYHLQITPHTDPQQVETILDSVQDWESKVPELSVQVTMDEGGCQLSAFEMEGCISIEGIPLKELDAIDTSDPEANGWADKLDPWRGYSTDIYFAMDSDPAGLGALIRHELGHALGLGHSPAGTVMYYSSGTDRSPVVTDDDVKEYRAIRR